MKLNPHFQEWQQEVVELIVKKQAVLLARYKKNRWKVNGTTFQKMFKEGLTSQQAANLWGLNHEK